MSRVSRNKSKGVNPAIAKAIAQSQHRPLAEYSLVSTSLDPRLLTLSLLDGQSGSGPKVGSARLEQLFSSIKPLGVNELRSALGTTLFRVIDEILDPRNQPARMFSTEAPDVSWLQQRGPIKKKDGQESLISFAVVSELTKQLVEGGLAQADPVIAAFDSKAKRLILDQVGVVYLNELIDVFGDAKPVRNWIRSLINSNDLEIKLARAKLAECFRKLYCDLRTVSIQRSLPPLLGLKADCGLGFIRREDGDWEEQTLYTARFELQKNLNLKKEGHDVGRNPPELSNSEHEALKSIAACFIDFVPRNNALEILIVENSDSLIDFREGCLKVDRTLLTAGSTLVNFLPSFGFVKSRIEEMTIPMSTADSEQIGFFESVPWCFNSAGWRDRGLAGYLPLLLDGLKRLADHGWKTDPLPGFLEGLPKLMSEDYVRQYFEGTTRFPNSLSARKRINGAIGPALQVPTRRNGMSSQGASRFNSLLRPELKWLSGVSGISEDNVLSALRKSVVPISLIRASGFEVFGARLAGILLLNAPQQLAELGTSEWSELVSRGCEPRSMSGEIGSRIEHSKSRLSTFELCAKFIPIFDIAKIFQPLSYDVRSEVIEGLDRHRFNILLPDRDSRRARNKEIAGTDLGASRNVRLEKAHAILREMFSVGSTYNSTSGINAEIFTCVDGIDLLIRGVDTDIVEAMYGLICPPLDNLSSDAVAALERLKFSFIVRWGICLGAQIERRRTPSTRFVGDSAAFIEAINYVEADPRYRMNESFRRYSRALEGLIRIDGVESNPKEFIDEYLLPLMPEIVESPIDGKAGFYERERRLFKRIVSGEDLEVVTPIVNWISGRIAQLQRGEMNSEGDLSEFVEHILKGSRSDALVIPLIDVVMADLVDANGILIKERWARSLVRTFDAPLPKDREPIAALTVGTTERFSAIVAQPALAELSTELVRRASEAGLKDALRKLEPDSLMRITSRLPAAEASAVMSLTHSRATSSDLSILRKYSDFVSHIPEEVEDRITGEYVTNYYRVLGVPLNASQELIKRSYRKLRAVTHSDKLRQYGENWVEFGDNLSKKIAEAHEVLSNPQRRAGYNRSINNRATNFPDYNWVDYLQSLDEEVDLRAKYLGHVHGYPREISLGSKGRLGPNCYAILGIPKGSTSELAHESYRRLSIMFHTDVGGEDGDDQLIKALNESHEILKDPAKKVRYDLEIPDNPLLYPTNAWFV